MTDAISSPTIGFVCPLYKEVRAVIATFDEELPPQEIEGVEYYYGKIGTRVAVAVHFLHDEIGPAVAATYANNLLAHHPALKKSGSYCFLVGIAGGIWSKKADVRLGDVVIATKVFDWRSGQMTQDGFVSTKHPEFASDLLRRKLGSFLYSREKLGTQIVEEISYMSSDLSAEGWEFPGSEKDDLFKPEYPHAGYRTCAQCDHAQIQSREKRALTAPWVHDGLIASGDVVLKDAASRKSLQDQRVLAVEMEACGVPRHFIVVRGISDYADSHKNDDWHRYAAATAAACARLFINDLTRKPELKKKPARLVHRTDVAAQSVISRSNTQNLMSASAPAIPHIVPEEQEVPMKLQPPPPPPPRPLSALAPNTFGLPSGSLQRKFHWHELLQNSTYLPLQAQLGAGISIPKPTFSESQLESSTRYEVDNMEIELDASKYGRGERTHDLGPSTIFYETQTADRLNSTVRRLRICSNDSAGNQRVHIFWLPLFDVWACEDPHDSSTFAIRFSNCTGPLLSGGAKGHDLRTAILIKSSRYAKTADLKARLLHEKDSPAFSTDGKTWDEYRYCNIAAGFITEKNSTNPSLRIPAMLIWHYEVVLYDISRDEYDIGSCILGVFSSKLDFEIQKNNAEVMIKMKYMRKFVLNNKPIKNLDHWMDLKDNGNASANLVSGDLLETAAQDSVIRLYCSPREDLTEPLKCALKTNNMDIQGCWEAEVRLSSFGSHSIFEKAHLIVVRYNPLRPTFDLLFLARDAFNHAKKSKWICISLGNPSFIVGSPFEGKVEKVGSIYSFQLCQPLVGDFLEFGKSLRNTTIHWHPRRTNTMNCDWPTASLHFKLGSESHSKAYASLVPQEYVPLGLELAAFSWT